MHPNSELLFRTYAASLFRPEMRVLEIGPDSIPSTYRRMVGIRDLDWQTLDTCDRPELTFPNSGEYSFPCDNAVFDIVLSGQVIEHVRKPWKWVRELARVLKPGGLVITIGPISWPYHEAPVDCWRIYPAGMTALHEEAGLETILAIWDSLETPGYKRHIPGVSLSCQTRWRRLYYRILGLCRLPVERSYDMIAIGRRPVQRQS